MENVEITMYSETLLYGHLLNIDTHIWQTVSFVLMKSSIIVFSKIHLLNADTG